MVETETIHAIELSGRHVHRVVRFSSEDGTGLTGLLSRVSHGGLEMLDRKVHLELRVAGANVEVAVSNDQPIEVLGDPPDPRRR